MCSESEADLPSPPEASQPDSEPLIFEPSPELDFMPEMDLEASDLEAPSDLVSSEGLGEWPVDGDGDAIHRERERERVCVSGHTVCVSE